MQPPAQSDTTSRACAIIRGTNTDDCGGYLWLLRHIIRRSMLTFGLTSTAFDVMTFWVLLTVSAGSEELFRTGWFLESLLTELSILLIIRSRAPLHRSRPGRFLAWSSGVVMLIAIALPFMPRAAALGLVALPLPVLGMILGITMLYVLVSESSKRFFYRTLDRSPPP